MTVDLPRFETTVFLHLTRQDSRGRHQNLYEYEYRKGRSLLLDRAINRKFKREGDDGARQQRFILHNADEKDAGLYFVEAAVDWDNTDIFSLYMSLYGDEKWPYESNRKHLVVLGK